MKILWCLAIILSLLETNLVSGQRVRGRRLRPPGLSGKYLGPVPDNEPSQDSLIEFQSQPESENSTECSVSKETTCERVDDNICTEEKQEVCLELPDRVECKTEEREECTEVSQQVCQEESREVCTQYNQQRCREVRM